MLTKKRPITRIVIYIALIAASPLLALALIRSSAEWGARALEKRYPPPGRMIAVGGYKLQLYCTGAGHLTVIIEPGMGVDWVGWRFVIPRLTPAYRVCVYDRAGYGWSDPGPLPRTALREAGELHALLTAAHVPGPYILVAHSYGGYIARIYASRFAESVAGVVLVEPSHEEEPEAAPTQSAGAGRGPFSRIRAWIPPLGIQRLERLYEGSQALPEELKNASPEYRQRYLVASSLNQLQFERNEFDSLPLSKAEVRQAAFPPRLPLTVITALHTLTPRDSHPVPELPAIHRELQGRLAASSLYGRQILALQSGHMVPLDQPDLIAGAIRDLLTYTAH